MYFYNKSWGDLLFVFPFVISSWDIIANDVSFIPLTRLTTFYSIQFGTKKYIRVPPLRFFSASVKIFFGPPFEIFLYFS
jgi:hypothetical protein